MGLWTLRRVALAATALGAVQATAVMAQAGDPGSPDDIVVTARRVEERLQDVPISITVFNQQQLNDRNVTSTTDLATYTPSLQVNTRYGADKASFIIRGFSQDPNTLPTVGVYFADVVAPRLQSNIGGGNGAGPGSVFDLQNVQVLKGPQGTLFGRNTTGGAILLVPQRPTDRLGGYVEGTYGNYDQKRVQAVLNVPLADSFKVRLGVDRYKRDGYIRNRSNVGPKDFADVDYLALRLGVLADLTPELENYLLATYTRSSTNGTIGRVSYCNNGTPGTVGNTGLAAILRPAVCDQVARERAAGYGYYDVTNTVPDSFVKSWTGQIINTTTWRAGDSLTIKNIVSYGEAREKYSFALNGDAPLIVRNGATRAFPFVITYPGPGRTQGAQRTVTEEFQLQGKVGDRLTYQGGFYMEISDPIRTQEQYISVLSDCANIYAFQCVTLPVGSSVSIARNVYRYRDYGVYAQATYRFTDRLGLTLGARNTWASVGTDGTNLRVIPSPTGALGASCTRAVTPTPNPGVTALVNSDTCRRSFTTRSKRPTWLIDLDYKPTPDMLIYLKYARGYRAGGVNEANVGIETWRPEKVDDFEAGVKASFRGPITGTIGIDGYWNEFKDQQTAVTIPQCSPLGNPGCTNPAPTGISGIQNVGKSRMRGVEADASIGYGPVRLDVGYSLLDAKVRGGSVPFCDTTRYDCARAVFLTAGNRLPFSPKNRLTLTGTFAVPVDEDRVGRISLAATFTHTDRLITSRGDAAAFAAGAIPFDGGISPATDLLNVNVNWRGILGSPVDIAAFATNVTKQRYYVALTNALSTIGGDSIILGEPRIYGVRLRYTFGR